MARIRTVKPSFFTNDQIAELPPLARLLFIGLWCVADKEGRLENRPKRLKVELLPYDNADIPSLLSALGEAKLIILYEAEGEGYIEIVNFVKHQRPHPKEPESVIPSPYTPKHTGKKRKAVSNNGPPLKETSNPSGREGVSGREQEGKEMENGGEPPSSPPSPQPTARLCDDEYLDSLQANPAYEPLDVRRLYGKMVAWCESHNKVPTRRRLVSWLNNEEVPMKAKVNGAVANPPVDPAVREKIERSYGRTQND